MIKRIAICLMMAASLWAAPPPARKPKLVVTVVIDQFRYDYLTRFRSEYTAGFNRLLTQGAVYVNARYEHFPTVTAIGHSTVLTGATPSISGIIGNDWYDRATGKTVTSVSDEETTLLGGKGGTGSSPRRLLVSTVGDEMKMATNGKAKVVGVSLKDRAAILPAGRMANGAYWFDNTSGNFVSSTFYFAAMPSWANEFDKGRPGDKYANVKWLDHTMPTDPAKLYPELASSPFGNELIEAFAEQAVIGEKLGKGETTDLLAVSFSSNDYIGHKWGPDSPEAHELAVRTDKLLGKFFTFLEAQVGMQNVVVILTGDHGVAPVAELQAERKMPGGRISSSALLETVQKALEKKYGPGKWVASLAEFAFYLNLDLIAEKKLDRAEVNRAAAEALQAMPHIFRVFTREQFMSGYAMEEQVARRMFNGYNPSRGADVVLEPEPYWVLGRTGTSHATTFSYDSHVPVIFMGPGIKAGRYARQVAVNDIAPTLATLLDVETPSGSVGHPLVEVLGN